MTVMFMTDAGRNTGDSKIDRLAMEYEDKYGQPLTSAQIERLGQLSNSSEYGNYAIDTSGFASDAPFGSPQRESELNAYMENLQDERNAKRANFTLENLGISPDQNGSFTQPTAPQDSMQGGLGGLGSIFDIMKKQMPAPPTQNRGPILDQGPGKGRRQMPTGPISDNRMPYALDAYGSSSSPYSDLDDYLMQRPVYDRGTRAAPRSPTMSTLQSIQPDTEDMMASQYEKIMAENRAVDDASRLARESETEQLRALLQEELSSSEDAALSQRSEITKVLEGKIQELMSGVDAETGELRQSGLEERSNLLEQITALQDQIKALEGAGLMQSDLDQALAGQSQTIADLQASQLTADMVTQQRQAALDPIQAQIDALKSSMPTQQNIDVDALRKQIKDEILAGMPKPAATPEPAQSTSPSPARANISVEPEAAQFDPYAGVNFDPGIGQESGGQPVNMYGGM